MQIGNMGGIAVAIDLRLEESTARLDLPTSAVARSQDEFIARRADVDLVLVKPVDGVLRRRQSCCRRNGRHELAARGRGRGRGLLLDLRARRVARRRRCESNELILEMLHVERPDDGSRGIEGRPDHDSSERLDRRPARRRTSS
jgi:hypothetical protein